MSPETTFEAAVSRSGYSTGLPLFDGFFGPFVPGRLHLLVGCGTYQYGVGFLPCKLLKMERVIDHIANYGVLHLLIKADIPYNRLACIDTNPWCFFINTDIRKFVNNQPDLLACQVSIKAKSHKCLDYDSYVDCTDLLPFENAELTDIKDQVDEETKIAIKEAVVKSKTLIKRHQQIILTS